MGAELWADMHTVEWWVTTVVSGTFNMTLWLAYARFVLGWRPRP